MLVCVCVLYTIVNAGALTCSLVQCVSPNSNDTDSEINTLKIDIEDKIHIMNLLLFCVRSFGLSLPA